MPRAARRKSKSGIYHIMLRGINKQTIFEDDQDCLKFIETLDRYRSEVNFKIYGYCLMGNHVHFILDEGSSDIQTIFKKIAGSYVYWYNWKYERIGPLFQDRFKSEVIEDDHYLLTALRYIHQNPVKAGIGKIDAYQWSSYSDYLNETGITDVNFVFELFSLDKETAKQKYKEYMNLSCDDTCLEIEGNQRLTDEKAREIIKATANVKNCVDVANIGEELRKKVIDDLKLRGLSIRQIARLTGLSVGIVRK